MVSRSSKQLVVANEKREPRPTRLRRPVYRDLDVAEKTVAIPKRAVVVAPEIHRRTSIDLETKVAMIKAMEEGQVKQVHVAKRFGVAKPTLCSILKNKVAIMDTYLNRSMDPSRMRMRKAQRPDMDEAVFKWYRECLDENRPVNGPLVMRKAAEFAHKLGHGKIKVSDGWLERFKIRHNIYFNKSLRRASLDEPNSIIKYKASNRNGNHRSTNRSKRSVEHTSIKNADHKSKRSVEHSSIKNADHKSKRTAHNQRSKKSHINVIRLETLSPEPPVEDDAIDVDFVYDPSDETIHDEVEMEQEQEKQEDVDVSLKYGPSDTFHAQEMCLFYHLQPEDSHKVAGNKFGGGEQSEERITVLFCCNASGTEKLPLLVVGSQPKVRRLANMAYESNCHSWMTQNIFRKWLQDLDSHMDRRVALVVDDTPVHAISMPMRKVHVFWAPPNHMHSQATTVIANLVKIHYRKKILIKDEAKLFNPLIFKDALDMLSSAWDQVTAEDISACFENDPSVSKLVSKVVESLRDRVEGSLPQQVTLLDYATSDGEACVAADLCTVVDIWHEKHHDPEPSQMEEEVVAVIPVLKKFVYAQDDPPNEVLKALSVLENYVHRKTLR